MIGGGMRIHIGIPRKPIISVPPFESDGHGDRWFATAGILCSNRSHTARTK